MSAEVGDPDGLSATEGITSVFLGTHDFRATGQFLQALGYDLEFETDHGSGQFTNGTSPTVFAAEVPAEQPAGASLVVTVADHDAYVVAPGVDVVSDWEKTHFGVWEMSLRDPDGRTWLLHAPR